MDSGAGLGIREFALAGAALLNVVLAAVLWVRGVRRMPEVLVPALALALASWSGAVFTALVSGAADGPLFWTRASFAGGSCVLLAIGLIALHFPYRESWAGRAAHAFFVIPAFAFGVLAWTPAIVVSSLREPSHVSSLYGWAHLPFTLYALATAVAAVSMLALKYRASSYAQRLRVRYFGIGVLLVVVTGTLTNAVLPRLGITGLNQVGPLTSVGFAGLTAYAIARHRLLDIEIVLRKGLVFSSLVGFVSLVAVAGLLLAQNKMAGSLSAPFAAVACATVIVFAFGPMRDLLERWTGRLFLGGRPDPAAMLSVLAGRLSGLKGVQGELDPVLNDIRAAFGAGSIRLYVRQGGTGNHELAYGRRLPSDGRVDSGDPLCRALFEGREPVTRDESAARARQSGSIEAAGLRDSLDARESEVAVPIVRGNEPAGILMFGPKDAGRAFRHRELEAATAVAAELSIALENRSLLEEVRRGERLAVLGTVAASVAHEIRNPLTGLKTYFETTKDAETDPMYWQNSETLRTMLGEQTGRAERLVNNLLNLANPKPVSIQPVALHDALSDVLMLQAHTYRTEKKIKAVLDVVQRATVLMDPGHLSQVMLNLVINAAKAMPAGGDLTIRLSVEASGEGRTARVDVADTGVGILPDQLAAIFEPFYTTRPDGTGLGLATAHKIVREYNGTLEVASEVGKGSTFTVRLPAV